MKLFSLILVLGILTPSLTPPGAEEKKPKRQTIEFEGEALEGSSRNQSLLNTLALKDRKNMNSLVKKRTDFKDQIQQDLRELGDTR